MARLRPRVADTSFLFALFVADDTHHAAARDAAGVAGPVVVPSEVLTETIGLLGHRVGRAEAAAVVAAMRAQRAFEFVHATEPQEALSVMDETGLSFVDAVVLWHCRRLGIPAQTFDDRLAALAKPS